MIFPASGLVYIPAQDLGWVWDPKGFSYFYRGPNGVDLAPQENARTNRGMIIGWDPKSAKAAWIRPQAEVMNGGVLATGGDLIVEGTENGYIEFRDATDGRLLRRIQTGVGVIAAPISYELGGEQYIAVAAGWNGAHPEPDPEGAPSPYENLSRLIVLKLGGGKVPVTPIQAAPPPPLSRLRAPAARTGRKGPFALPVQLRPLPRLRRRADALPGPASARSGDPADLRRDRARRRLQIGRHGELRRCPDPGRHPGHPSLSHRLGRRRRCEG